MKKILEKRDIICPNCDMQGMIFERKEHVDFQKLIGVVHNLDNDSMECEVEGKGNKEDFEIDKLVLECDWCGFKWDKVEDYVKDLELYKNKYQTITELERYVEEEGIENINKFDRLEFLDSFYYNKINKKPLHYFAKSLLINLIGYSTIVNVMGLNRQEYKGGQLDDRILLFPENKLYCILKTVLKRISSNDVKWFPHTGQENYHRYNKKDCYLLQEEKSKLNPPAKEIIERLDEELYSWNINSQKMQGYDGGKIIKFLLEEEIVEILNFVMERMMNKEIKWRESDDWKKMLKELDESNKRYFPINRMGF